MTPHETNQCAAIGRRHCAIAIILTLTLLLGSNLAFAADKVVLQLRWHHSFQFAGYYAALWQGYYAKAGLDVQIRDSFSPDKKYLSPIREVAEGRAEFGIAGSEILVGENRCSLFMVLAPIFQESPITIFSKESTPLSTPADLKHLNLGMFTRGNVAEAEVQAMLKNAGLDPVKDAPRITVTRQRLADLAAGRIDAAVGYITELDRFRDRLGPNLRQLKPSSFGVNFYGDSLFTSQIFAEKAPHIVKAFQKASLKGWRYALTHSSEIVQRIARQYRAPHHSVKVSEALIRSQVEPVTRLTHFPAITLGANDLGRWRRIHKSFVAAGVGKGDPPSADFVYDPAREQRRHTQMVIFASGLGLLLVMAIAITAWVVTLRRSIRSRTRDLTDSEARYRDLIEGSSLGIQISGADGKFYYVNRAVLTLFGYDNIEEMATTRASLIAPHDRERLMCQEESRWRGEDAPEIYECDGAHKNGTIIPIQLFARRIRWDGRDAIQRTIIDLTDLRNTERALQESEAKLRKIFEATGIGISTRNTRDRTIWTNDAFCRMLGYTQDELEALHLGDITHPDDHEKCGRYRGQLLAGEIDSYQIDKRFIHKDGETIWVINDLSAVCDDQGNVVYTINVIQDVTRQRQAEEQLRQSQKMDSMGTLAGGVAHELNNMLMPIVGLTELTIAEIPEGSRSRKNLGAVLQSARRAAEPVDKILSFSHHNEAESKVVDLRGVIEEEMGLLGSTLPATIHINLELGKDPVKVLADETQLHLVLMNLASNAAYAMEGKVGELTISLAAVDLLDQSDCNRLGLEPDAFAKLSVKDTGHGMDEATRGRIFEPFYTTKAVGEGTGMGLAMIHGMVAGNGGAIDVSSAPGTGTTIDIYLPLAEENKPALAVNG